MYKGTRKQQAMKIRIRIRGGARRPPPRGPSQLQAEAAGVRVLVAQLVSGVMMERQVVGEQQQLALGGEVRTVPQVVGRHSLIKRTVISVYLLMCIYGQNMNE